MKQHHTVHGGCPDIWRETLKLPAMWREIQQCWSAVPRAHHPILPWLYQSAGRPAQSSIPVNLYQYCAWDEEAGTYRTDQAQKPVPWEKYLPVYMDRARFLRS